MIAIGPRAWIDILLLAGGAAAVASGWPQLGAPLVALGFVSPILHLAARRRGGVQSLLRFVPAELADAHRRVVAAAALGGVVDASSVVTAADDVVVGAAALLAGRAPRGAAQRRFVAARVRAFNATVTELTERHAAWVEARDEVDGLDSMILPDAPGARPSGVLTGVLLVLLFPAFLIWDLAVGAVRVCSLLSDGIVLRVRAAGLLFWRAGHGLVMLAAGARRMWRDARSDLALAGRESRRRFLSAHLQLRLRLRGAHRASRG
jgi:hypothetical protein